MLVRVLKEPKNSLMAQQEKLFAMDDVSIPFIQQFDKIRLANKF
jgi:ATP-dependent protease Clp ATPase subunit